MSQKIMNTIVVLEILTGKECLNYLFVAILSKSLYLNILNDYLVQIMQMHLCIFSA